MGNHQSSCKADDCGCRIEHFLHTCRPLRRVVCPEECEFRCDGCNLDGAGSRYRCERCDFDLHLYCATCPRTLHSSVHRHPLELLVRGRDDGSSSAAGSKMRCASCKEEVAGMYYWCQYSCNFVIHPVCVAGYRRRKVVVIDPKEGNGPNGASGDQGRRQTMTKVQVIKGPIVHFLHPNHTLTLVEAKDVDGGSEFTCDGCRLAGMGSRYSCEKGDFQLHVYCAKCPEKLPRSSAHAHELVRHARSQMAGMRWSRKECRTCKKEIEELFYWCELCDFAIHPVCIAG